MSTNTHHHTFLRNYEGFEQRGFIEVHIQSGMGIDIPNTTWTSL